MIGNKNFENNYFIKRFLKGIFNLRPPVTKYIFTWDVGRVLKYLETLYPLHNLTLKMVTLKCVALMALATAQRSQTLASLDLKLAYLSDQSITFKIGTLLKTSRPKNLNPEVTITSFSKAEICPYKTLKHYILRTQNIRKSNKLFVSFKTFKSITSCSIARWLRIVLSNSGIDISKFKAHSFRAASSTAASNAGISLNEILKTANWASAQTFKKFYFKNIENDKNNSRLYVNSVFKSNLQSDQSR